MTEPDSTSSESPLLDTPPSDTPPSDTPPSDTPVFDEPLSDSPLSDEALSDQAGSDEAGSDEAGSDEEGDADDHGDEDDPVRRRLRQLEAEGDIAADYLEELLDIADLDGDLDMDVEGDRAAVSIVGADLQSLVGADGQVLEALQELTRLAVYRETGERSRMMLDIGGYRADLRKQLVQLAQEAVDDVRETGEPVKLSPMTPFERKVVHDAVAAGGLRSESEGVEPTRCVVVLPS